MAVYVFGSGQAHNSLIRRRRLQSGCSFRFVALAVSQLVEFPSRMGGRVVEGTGLENRQTRKRLEGSNPSPSANKRFSPFAYIKPIDLACCHPLYPHYLMWLDSRTHHARSGRDATPDRHDLPPQREERGMANSPN